MPKRKTGEGDLDKPIVLQTKKKKESNLSVTNNFPYEYKRWVDGSCCALLDCSKPISVEEDAVVVATNEKIRSKLTEKQKAMLLAKWAPGRIVFHMNCWEKLKGQTKTMHQKEALFVHDGDDTAEYYDCVATLKQKVQQAVPLILNAKHMVAFTGAGISTEAGIDDYRGTAGVDTRQYMGQGQDDDDDVQYEKLQPTIAHNTLADLIKLDRLKYIITQNCDNLHLKSGVPSTHISELHGNVFIEYCEECGKEYQRDFCVDLWSTNCYKEKWYVKCSTCKLNHYTSRKCSVKKCGGRLRDTIVNFGDMLHDKVCGGLPKAEENSKISDLMLCLGSSLTVSPANSLTSLSKQLVICNLQRTSQDSSATVRVFAPCNGSLRCD
jgi:mono-ADP-ribosyltransferase sirtuin 6